MNLHHRTYYNSLGEWLLNTPFLEGYSLGFNHGVILRFLSTFATITLIFSDYVVVSEALKGFKAINPGERTSYLLRCATYYAIELLMQEVYLSIGDTELVPMKKYS